MALKSLLAVSNVIAWLALQLVCAAEPQTFFVAADGNDENLGTRELPFATLIRARDAARTTKLTNPKAVRRIVVREGDYFLEAPVLLTAADSGLVVEAAAGERPVLYGGKRIGGWRREGQFWMADIPEAKTGDWDFRMLLVNGRMCPRARLPRVGYFTHLNRFTMAWRSTIGGGWGRPPTKEELTTLVLHSKDMGPWLETPNAEIDVHFMWNKALFGIAAINPAAHTIKLSANLEARPIDSHMQPPGAHGIRQYSVWNVREGMMEPGQWFLDRTQGRVFYWPLIGEDITTARVIAPKLESVVVIRGNKDAPARNITLQGMALSATNSTLNGYVQAGALAGAIDADACENLRLENLTITNVGGGAIRAGNPSEPWNILSLRVVDCEISHTGGYGISAAGRDLVIRNNHVHHAGMIYGTGGMYVGGPVRRDRRSRWSNLVLHNEIHDTAYNGITGRGDNLHVEANVIYRVMQELHDGAGIQLANHGYGGSGIVVRGNLVRDITDTGGYGAEAYYLDEKSARVIFEGNMSIEVSCPLKCNLTEPNLIRNNVFINDGDIRIELGGSSGLEVERNVIWAKRDIFIQPMSAIGAGESNIVYSAAGRIEAREVGPRSQAGDPRIKALASDSRWHLVNRSIRS